MSGFGSTIAKVERFASTFSVEALSTVLPPGMVQEVLTECGAVSRRRRSLPAELVLWLTVMAALGRSDALDNVLARLRKALCLPEEAQRAPLPTSAAISKARRRLGVGPLRTLFERVAQAWIAPLTYAWKGMALLAVDGTTLRMPDSDANRQAFGSHHTHGKSTAYPQARALVVMCALTHVILRAALGTARTSERALLPEVMSDLPQKALFLLDRGFFAYDTLWQIVTSGRHFIVRERAHLRCRFLRQLGRNDRLVELLPSAEIRRRHPEVPARWILRQVTYQRPGFRPVELLTSLTDPIEFPAEEIAARYHDRWEVELGFDELKTHLLGKHIPFRSKLPELIRQEFFADLLAFNAARILMAQAAHRTEQEPRRLSFAGALVHLRGAAAEMAVKPASRLPALFEALLNDIAHGTLPPRRPRNYPRVVKASPCYYPIRRRGRAA